MQELERMIDLYHTAFIVCLVLTCVFTAVSVFLFFKFDIKKILDMKTGRGAKKTIQKMEEINARTGKLRQDMVSYTPPVLKADERITYPTTSPNLAQQSQGSVTQPVTESAAQTAPLSDTGEQETTLLYQSSETTVLSHYPPAQPAKKELNLPGAFNIERELMWVHTEEVL